MLISGTELVRKQCHTPPRIVQGYAGMMGTKPNATSRSFLYERVYTCRPA